MYDDILYIDKQHRPFLSREEIIEYCRIKMDVDFIVITTIALRHFIIAVIIITSTI